MKLELAMVPGIFCGVRRSSDRVDCSRFEKECPPRVLMARAGSECDLLGRCLATCHKEVMK